MLVIKKKNTTGGGGGAGDILQGTILLWSGLASAIPSGWTILSIAKDRYVVGESLYTNYGSTGGAATHLHAYGSSTGTGEDSHTHTVNVTSIGDADGWEDTQDVKEGSAKNLADEFHGHALDTASTGAPTSHSHSLSNTQTASNNPKYHRLYYILATQDDLDIPNGAILWWDDDIANLPANFVQCDGNNSTPDLRDRFVFGADEDGDVGGTGSGSHSHANDDTGSQKHTHHISITLGASDLNVPVASGTGAWAPQPTHTHSIGATSLVSGAHTHAVPNTASAEITPLYYKLHHAMATQDISTLSIGSIIGWSLSTIPDGWVICDGNNGTPNLNDKFVRCANTDGDLGETGGSNTHQHTGNPSVGSDGAGSHYHSTVSNKRIADTAGSASNDAAEPWPYDPPLQNVGTTSHSHEIEYYLGSGNEADHNHSMPDTENAEAIPPYVKIRYIMRIS